MNGPRNLILATMFVILAAGFSTASNIYIAQNAAGGNTGADCADAHAVAWFNSSSNWGSNTGLIGPGTTAHLCGTITTALAFQGSGSSSSVITLLFEKGASIQISPGASTNGAIGLGANSYILIDGGSGQPCGWNTATDASEGSCNGKVENMLYGSVGATCPGGPCTTQPGTSDTLIAATGSNIEIRDLEIGPSYIHTASSNDPNGTSCVAFSNGSNWNIHDSKLHDGGWCVNYTYSGGKTYSNWSLLNNELYNNGHMIAVGGAGISTLNGFNMVGNYCHDMNNWDSSSDYWHNNCIHMFGASTTTATNVLINNNIAGGNMGNNPTAQFFIEAQSSTMTNLWFFNNLVYGIPSNGRLLLLNVCMSGCYVVNNTLVGSNTSGVTASYVGGNGSTNTALVGFENNVNSDAFGVIDSETASFGTLNHNVYGVQGNFVWNGSFQTGFSQWQTTSKGDANSVNSPSGISLDANFKPEVGSPVIGAGTNLTSLCGTYSALCSDLAGVARPSSGAWDVGAFQYSGGGSKPNPPTGLSASVQ